MSNNYLSEWAANTIVPAGMHILCIALRYNKPNKSENHIYYISLIKLNFEVRNILNYKIFINKF